ncbi:Uncharacterized protein pbN1_25280 [Aromatoleum bremense]|nr:Uncharacterized protein pbN1_25280 [Aromatoleum bremense]
MSTAVLEQRKHSGSSRKYFGRSCHRPDADDIRDSTRHRADFASLA